MKELLGKYEFLKKIGEGGMSTVYLAMDTKINKQWAIKEIHKNTREYQATVDEGTVLQEVNLIKELDHYGLPRIVDIVDTKESIYVVMDYIEGLTIRKYLDINGLIPQEEAVKYALQILEILYYLHSQNPPIIYRDLKPSNVIVKPDGTIKIIDFGIARRFKKNKDDTVIIGTKGFAPPEQRAGKSDTRSDIYSFGVTLYQMLTNKSVNQEPYYILPITEVNPELSSGLEKIIDKCTKEDPKERYQAVEEVIYDVAHYKELEEKYIAEHRKKVKKFTTRLIAGVLCITIGIMGNIGLIVKAGSDYNSLIALQEIDSGKRIENLVKAIEINPNEFKAYELILREFTKTGFNEDKAKLFFEIFNRNKANIDSTKEAELNFLIGKTFVSYFQGETDKSNRNALTYAKSFFTKASNSKDKNIRRISKSYIFLAEYQDRYFLESTALGYEEPSVKECNENLRKIYGAILNLKNYSGSEDIRYLKIFTYQTILDILENESELYIANHISYNNIGAIISSIENEVRELDVNMHDAEEKIKDILQECRNFKSSYENSVEYREKINSR